MAQRRPITSHPAFVALVALWFAALMGLGVAVLPAPLLERIFAAAGLDALRPLTPGGRLTASAMAALLGALLGLTLAMALARRGAGDPRPIYAEPDPAMDDTTHDEPVRRPLHVREEFVDFAASAEEAGLASEPCGPLQARTAPDVAQAEEGFMILTPQPIHPPRPAPDLQALLEQFDTAISAFRDGADTLPAAQSTSPNADPVHAFVARATGTRAPSPLGGRIPDHQAELRAALDKLARAHRKD